MEEEKLTYELIKNYKHFINNDLMINEQIERFKNKEQFNLLLKILNDHCDEEDIKNAINSGFIEKITKLNNSNLLYNACVNENENLYKFFLTNNERLETLDIKEVVNGLGYIVSSGNIIFFEECIKNENIKQKIIKENLNLSPLIKYNYCSNQSERMNESIKKILAKLIFGDEELINLVRDEDVLSEVLIDSIVFEDLETFEKFVNNTNGENLIEKIFESKTICNALQKAATKAEEYYKKMLEYEKVRLSKNEVENISNITINFVTACCPDNNASTVEIQRKTIETILQYEDAKELICKDFLLLCKRLHSEFAVEYLINNDELLNKILENNNNAIEKAFIDSWTNNEGSEVAKVLFNNDKTRGFIKPETIESCFKAACMNNSNLKKLNLLIDKIGPNIINKYFKLTCEYGNLEIVKLLATKVEDSDKIKIFHDTFLTKNDQLSEQTLRLSSILIKNIKNKQLLEIEDNDYKTFKNNTNELIENLFEKNDKDRENKIDKIKNDIKKMKKEKNKNNSWKDKTNFEKMLSIFYKIEENLANFDNEKQQGNLILK